MSENENPHAYTTGWDDLSHLEIVKNVEPERELKEVAGLVTAIGLTDENMLGILQVKAQVVQEKNAPDFLVVTQGDQVELPEEIEGWQVHRQEGKRVEATFVEENGKKLRVGFVNQGDLNKAFDDEGEVNSDEVEIVFENTNSVDVFTDVQVEKEMKNKMEQAIIEKKVVRALEKECGKMTETINQVLALRQTLEQYERDKKIEKIADHQVVRDEQYKNDLIEEIKNSPFYKERQKILDAEINSQDISNIKNVNEKFTNSESEFEGLVNGLIDYQEQRLIKMGVPEDKRRDAMLHINQVVEKARSAPNGEPLVTIIVAVHDITKYLPKTPVPILQEHGVASAIDGQKALKVALVSMDIGENEIESVVKLAGKAILAHDEYEWPERQASRSPIQGEDGEIFLHSLFATNNGVYLKPPRSNEIVWGRLAQTEDEKLLSRIVMGVSEADKMVGIRPSEKYIGEAPDSTKYEKYSTCSNFIDSFSGTMIHNWTGSPDGIGLKNSQETREELRQSALLFYGITQIEDYPQMLKIMMAEADRREGGGRFVEIFDLLQRLQSSYAKGKDAYDTENKIVTSQENQEFKKIFGELLTKLGEEKIPDSEEGELGSTVSHWMEHLAVVHTGNKDALNRNENEQ